VREWEGREEPPYPDYLRWMDKTMGFKHAILNKMVLGGKHKVLPEEPLPVEGIVSNVRNTGKKALDFQKLFLCYRNPSSIDLFALELLAAAIFEGYLNIEAEFIVITPNISETLEDIGRGRVVESGEHQGMKAWVIDLLNAKGITAAEEVSLLGYQVDVGCVSKGLFIECGDTEPSKVFSILFNGYSIGLLQFDSEHIVWFRPRAGFQRRFERDAMDYFGLCYVDIKLS
jgi:hypothetical protein